MAAGWRTVTLVAVVGLTMVGLSFAVPDSTVLIGLSSVLPHGLPLLLRVLGVCLCVLAAFALRDLLHGRQSVRYWQQHRRAH